jgi:hypothetical protein
LAGKKETKDYKHLGTELLDNDMIISNRFFSAGVADAAERLMSSLAELK